MNKRVLENYSANVLIGLVLGLIYLHPVAMVLIQPVQSINILEAFKLAFSPDYYVTALFFAILGMAIGILNAFYLRTISKAMNRVEMLEGLLPICSYCKKIRDDTGTAPGEGTWQQVEQYMHEKAATKFTHGVCPDCVEKAFPQKKP